MENNNLLMIILAFVVGFMLQGMMKNMCGGRLLEGSLIDDFEEFIGLSTEKAEQVYAPDNAKELCKNKCITDEAVKEFGISKDRDPVDTLADITKCQNKC